MSNFDVPKSRAKSLDTSIIYNSIHNIMSNFYVPTNSLDTSIIYNAIYNILSNFYVPKSHAKSLNTQPESVASPIDIDAGSPSVSHLIFNMSFFPIK